MSTSAPSSSPYDHGSPYDHALRALVNRDHANAERVLTAMLATDSGDAGAWFLSGRLAAERGDFSREMELTRRAVQLKPDSAEYVAHLGKCHARAQDMARAIDCAEQAEAGTALSDLTLDAIAAIYTRFGLHSRAAEALRRADAAGTCNPAVLFNLGASLKFCGDFAGARRALERAIELAPGYHKAHAALTSLGHVTAEANHLDRLSALIRQTEDPRARIHLSHAAAKECEALGDYDAAFAWLAEAKADLRPCLPQDSNGDTYRVERLIDGFDGDRLSPGLTDARPIFVVGMPRSGTTVVDRILSNHSTVTSIGEAQHFGQLLKTACGSQTRHLLDNTVIDQAPGIDMRALGQAYMTQGAALAGGAERFLDKFHLNIWLAGYIARALPDARIVCLIRNPLDTIVSNYRQLFEFTTPLYGYSFDLEATARFYVAFRKLAAFWAERFPTQFRTVSYEALVADPDGQSRSLLEFCGLPWEDQCSRIETHTGAVATASAVQVRRPINRDSVNAWQRYERHLDPVKSILREAGYAV